MRNEERETKLAPRKAKPYASPRWANAGGLWVRTEVVRKVGVIAELQLRQWQWAMGRNPRWDCVRDWAVASAWLALA